MILELNVQHSFSRGGFLACSYISLTADIPPCPLQGPSPYFDYNYGPCLSYGSCYWKMVLETEIWVLGVLIVIEGSLLFRLWFIIFWIKEISVLFILINSGNRY